MPIITIPGKPFGKQRPRFVSRGKFGKAYTPDETVNYEVMVKMLSIEAGCEPIDGAVAIWIVAYFEPPKSVSKKKRETMLCGEIKPTVKPDADNIAKVILDGLSHLFDDKQVVRLLVEKTYASKSTVTVRWLSTT